MPARNVVIGQKIDSAKVRLAKQLRRNMTPAERLLWQALRRNSVGGLHFRRQQVIAGFVVDFYCHSLGLVVELDGSVHEQQKENDTARDAILTGLGLRVLRISNDEVTGDLDGVLRKIVARQPNPRPLP
jgi:very-short-patch-repair endonuclease